MAPSRKIEVVLVGDAGDLERSLAGALASLKAFGAGADTVGTKNGKLGASFRALTSNWKILVPAIAEASVAVLAFTGNMAALAPLVPVMAIALTGLLAPFTTLAAIVVGFIPPLTLLATLLGGLAVAFGVSGQQALSASKRYTGLAKIVGEVKSAFSGLVATLIHDFMPTFKFLGESAASALTYLTKIAHLPLKQAFESLSTTGVAGFQKFLDKIGHLVAKPIRLAFQVAFGKSDTLRNALVDDWNDIVKFFVGHKGVLLPVQKWFGKQDFTAVGYRWASELAGAMVAGLGMALMKALSSRGGQLILGGGVAGASIGLAIGGPIGAAVGAAMGVAIGAVLNHYWPQITADATAAFHKVGALLKQALGPQLWGDIISLARSFWDTIKAIGGYIQNHVYPVVRHVFDALGGWHTVGVVIVAVVRSIVGAFVAVATVVRIVYNAIQTIVHWVQRAASAVGGPFAGAWGAVRSAVGAVASAISAIVSGIQTAIGAAHSLASALLGAGGSSNGVNGTSGFGGGRFGGVIHPATGGLVTGGTPGRDSVPALLTPGEIVLNKEQQLSLLRGGSGGVTAHFHFPNALVVDAQTIKQAARLIQPELNRLQARRA